MSLFNQNQKKHKKYIYPKESIKINKSFDNSSKSTRATSKNILALNNQKFYEKTNYCDLYSNLLCTRQTEKNIVKKRYPKEEDEESNNSLKNFEKFIFKKNKKSSVQKKLAIKFVKYYNEDGEIIKFPLFNERDIKIDEYDNKVKIESAEDDFESDECTLDYGKKKVNNDLLEALDYIKKENTNCLVNYKKYGKYIKKPKKKLDLRKNLPYIPTSAEK
jgi:hypothetical protein